MNRILLAGLTAAALAGIASEAAAFDRRVKIVNDSQHKIVGFFATNVGFGDWNESLLGEDVLATGASVVLNFEDGSGYCRFRFRAVFEDGVALERANINICEVGTYRYTD